MIQTYFWEVAINIWAVDHGNAVASLLAQLNGLVSDRDSILYYCHWTQCRMDSFINWIEKVHNIRSSPNVFVNCSSEVALSSNDEKGSCILLKACMKGVIGAEQSFTLSIYLNGLSFESSSLNKLLCNTQSNYIRPQMILIEFKYCQLVSYIKSKTWKFDWTSEWDWHHSHMSVSKYT